MSLDPVPDSAVGCAAVPMAERVKASTQRRGVCGGRGGCGGCGGRGSCRGCGGRGGCEGRGGCGGRGGKAEGLLEPHALARHLWPRCGESARSGMCQPGTPSRAVSFPRKRESSGPGKGWVPACAGTTQGQVGAAVPMAERVKASTQRRGGCGGRGGCGVCGGRGRRGGRGGCGGCGGCGGKAEGLLVPHALARHLWPRCGESARSGMYQPGTPSRAVSFPRKRESSGPGKGWVPAFAGTTQGQVGAVVPMAERMTGDLKS
jgi:hypothetical protein